MTTGLVNNLPVISDAEREAFLWMQGRMVELLLRHDATRFSKTFDERSALPNLLEDERLSHYRELAVVVYLKDELFDHILPRIKRRLSFEAPRQTQVEAMPARGRIDWARTAAANWRERPGEVPLEVHTRQRRRHFATPENLLTVVTILEYRQLVLRLLDDEANRDALQALLHPINQILDLCTRELAFLQFAGLISQCEAIVNGYSHSTSEELEQQVLENLLPGHNSAYSDLLDWRAKLKSLRLLDRNVSQDNLQNMLGADPNRDNYLYQLWLFYEIGDLLQRLGRVQEWDYRGMWLTYKWGEGAEEREYRLQHDQSIQGIPQYWEKAPGVRPDFYIERTDRQIIRDGTQTIWHEPGFMLDAKYYKPTGSVKAPSSPVKRMIADLQLMGERYGALLFAFQQATSDKTLSSPTDMQEETDEVNKLLTSFESAKPKGAVYQVEPTETSAHYIQPDIKIGIWRLRPELPGNGGGEQLRNTLLALLENVHQTLKLRIELRCRGVFLDSLSANGQGELVDIEELYQRDGQGWSGSFDDLLLCPKPHIAPWRVDLVSLSKDCCKNSRLCHVKALPNVKPPQRLTALEEIKDAIRSTGSKAEDTTEEAVAQAATKQVLVITRRYADLIKPNIEEYTAQIRREVGPIFDTSSLLTTEQRHTLALGYFLKEQVERIGAANFAGPALLFTGVLEELVRKTVYQHTTFRNSADKEKTLGGILYNRYEFTRQISASHLWKEQVSIKQTYKFQYWLDDLKIIKNIRNQAAHEAKVSRTEFEELMTAFFGSRSTGAGAFTGLLLVW